MKPIPLYIFILLCLPLFSVGLFLYHPQKTFKKPSTVINQNFEIADASARIVRENDTGLIKPLLLVEINNEQNFASVRTKINNYIEQKKKQGTISSASVYLNDLNTANHIEINPEELYDPASLMKVPLMIIYLKESESAPGLLQKKFLYKENIKGTYAATIKDKTLIPGKSYSVEDLLYYMIVYSDNQAFWLLADNIDNHKFDLLNKDFDIPIKFDNLNHGDKGQNFIANVNSMSRFFRVLYNASYLNEKMSLYALNLLTQCNYKEGILRGVDSSTKVAHKFGERVENGVAEFHEFGIVYLRNRPYLLGVMSKGNQLNQLPEFVGDISEIAFNEMKIK